MYRLSIRFTRTQSYLIAVGLPALTASGAKIMSAGITPAIAHFSLLCISLVPLLLASGAVPDQGRGPILYGLGVAVLWQTTLVTGHLWGWDVHFMYHVSRVVETSGVINLQRSGGHGSMVAVTWLAAIIHAISNLSLVTIYKWVFPMIAAGIPVTLFAISCRIFDNSILTALSPIGFIFFYRYFKVIPGKQPLGQFLGLVLILTFFIPTARRNMSRRLVSVIVGAGLIIIHHSTAVIFMFYVGFALLFSIVATFITRADREATEETNRAIAPFLLLIVGWLYWYSEIIGGSVIASAIGAGARTIIQIIRTLGIIDSRSGGSPGATRTGTGYVDILLNNVTLAISGALTALIVGVAIIGVAYLVLLLFTRRQNNILFVGLSVAASGFIVGGIVASFGMGFDRIISYGLLVISIVVPLGFIVISRSLNRIFQIDITRKKALQVTAISLGLMFIFGSGLAFVVTDPGDAPDYTLGINADSTWRTFSADEVAASRWTSEHVSEGVGIFGAPGALINERDGLLLVEVFYPDQIVKISPNHSSPPDCNVMYTSERPMGDGDSPDGWLDPRTTTFYKSYLSEQPKIYDSGKANLYSCHQ